MIVSGILLCAANGNQVFATNREMRCATTHYPPYTTYHAETNTFSGKDIDILKKLGKKMSITFKVVNLPWPRVLNEIKGTSINRYFDCYLSLAKTAARSRHVEFSSVPMHITRYSLFYLSDHKSFNASNLSGKLFGILNGVPLPPEIYIHYDFSNTSFTKVNRVEGLYKMLINHRIDGFIIGYEVGMNLQQHQKLNFFIFKDYFVSTFIAFKKGTVNIDKVNKALKTILNKRE